MQSVRADAIGRHGQRRVAFPTGRAAQTRGSTGEADVEYDPPIAIRMRPLSHARKLWANAAGSSSRLGMDAKGNRVEFVTEPKTGLKLPGKDPPRAHTVTRQLPTHHNRSNYTPSRPPALPLRRGCRWLEPKPRFYLYTSFISFYTVN